MCLMAQMKAYTMLMKNCTLVSLFIHLAKQIQIWDMWNDDIVLEYSMKYFLTQNNILQSQAEF